MRKQLRVRGLGRGVAAGLSRGSADYGKRAFSSLRVFLSCVSNKGEGCREGAGSAGIRGYFSGAGFILNFYKTS